MKILVIGKDSMQIASGKYNEDKIIKLNSVLELDGGKFKLTDFVEVYDHYLIFKGEEL